MEEHPKGYKQYSMQVKKNNILLLKQNGPLSSRSLEGQSSQTKMNIRAGKGIIILQPTDQEKLEPFVSKIYEEYLNKTIQSTKNAKVFNEFLQHQKVRIDKKRKNEKIFAHTSLNISTILSEGKKFDLKSFINQENTSRYNSNQDNHKKLPLPQKQHKPSNLDHNFIGRLNKSIQLSNPLGSTFTFTEIPNQKVCKQFSTSLYKLEKDDLEKQDFLKIQGSILVDRKTIPPLLKSIQIKKALNNDQIKKRIQKKIEHRNEVFEQICRDKVRRSLNLQKSPKKVNFLDLMNSARKQQFSLMDLIKVSLVNSMIDDVKFNMNGCFFSAYVQEGNNSDLVKSMIQRTNGWRVSEMIEVSNFVWTQNYRRNLNDKKPNRTNKEKTQEQNKNPQQNLDFDDTKTGQLSRSFPRKNLSSQQKFLQEIPQIENKQKPPIEGSQSRIYPQLSLSKYRIQLQQLSFEKQLRKLLPEGFMLQNFVLKSEKEAKVMAINSNLLIHNHLIGHRSISDKKNLLFNLSKFYISQKINPFDHIPQSHDISVQNDEFLTKQNQKYVYNSQMMKKEVWIVKPGEDSNRGRGIVICKGWESVVTEICKRLKSSKQKSQNDSKKKGQENEMGCDEALKQNKTKNTHRISIILQRYIMPLLYNGRKFDIRSYMLVTWVNGVLNGYFYEECYIRTSSKQFNIYSQNKYVHLTNDAVQCQSHDYGKHEEGNKVSEAVFSKYFQQLSSEKKKTWKDIKSQISQKCKDILKSSSKKLVGRNGNATQNLSNQKKGFLADISSLKRRQESISEKTTSQKDQFLFSNTQLNHVEVSFELFGLDFMIDESLKLWLIEVNTNPAITHDCSRVLNRLIPRLLDNTFALAVMPFMRPSRISQGQYQNRYHHIYQEKIDS